MTPRHVRGSHVQQRAKSEAFYGNESRRRHTDPCKKSCKPEAGPSVYSSTPQTPLEPHFPSNSEKVCQCFEGFAGSVDPSSRRTISFQWNLFFGGSGQATHEVGHFLAWPTPLQRKAPVVTGEGASMASFLPLLRTPVLSPTSNHPKQHESRQRGTAKRKPLSGVGGTERAIRGGSDET